MAPRELTRLDHAGLIMDMIATRDIEVGEEIYLDYGKMYQPYWKMKNPSSHKALRSFRRRLGAKLGKLYRGMEAQP